MQNRVNVPFLDLKWQHAKIKDNLKIRWDKILENTAFVIGDEVKLFEKNFAEFCGVKYCVGVSSGTDALVLGLKSLNLPKNSQVICLPTSFIASAEAIVHAGFVPKFSEVDLETGNYNYDLLEKTLENSNLNNGNKKISAIMAVHLYGRMCDMDKILEIAKKYNLKVIEDAAQAQGATYKNKNGEIKSAGSVGDVGCFSFYPGKNLGAYGQAGGIVTNDDKIFELVKRMRDHGSLGKYDHDVLGYNAKIDNIQASVLDEKLKHLLEWNKIRQEIAKQYYSAFQNDSDKNNLIKIISPNNSDTESVHHIFALRIESSGTKNREDFINKMKEWGIATNIHYPQALHEFSYLQNECKKGDFPVAEKLQSETVSIPLYPGMSHEQINYVIEKVREYFNYETSPALTSFVSTPFKGGNTDKEISNSKSLKLGIVGYGYWSPKVINGFQKAHGGDVYAICEKDSNKHEEIKKQIPDVKIYLHFAEMINDENVEAVVVTTTVSSHYRIAKDALEKNKHVLVEKPMTEYLWQSEELVKLAKQKNKILMVDHTFLFMPAILELKKIIDSGELGIVHTVTGNRSNLGLLQKDIDVVADLAPHDFSILYYLFNQEPEKIIATNHTPIKHKYQDKSFSVISSTSLYYKSGLFVNFIHSWISPVKDRRMIFIGDKKMAVFDMLDKEGQLKIYDTKINFVEGDKYGRWFEYVQGNYKVIDLPKMEGDDIQRMSQEFIDAINEKREPRTGGILGKVVVNTLRKVDNSKKSKMKFYTDNLKQNFKRIFAGNVMLK